MDFEEVKYRIDTEIEYAKNKIAALKTIEGSGRMRTDLREYTELLGEPQLLQEEMSDLERFKRLGEYRRTLETPVETLKDGHPALREAKIAALGRIMEAYVNLGIEKQLNEEREG